MISEKETLRECVEALIRAAAQAGFENPARLMDMTAWEVEMELESFTVRQRRTLERMDLLAWLTGRYVLSALHTPRRYPARPDAILCARREMDAEEMKRVFACMMERRDADGGG